jgi:hypothetical protein
MRNPRSRSFLWGPEGDEVDIRQFEEMRERTELAGFVQRRPQNWAWLEALPIVSFRRLDFVVFDNWTSFCQQQSAEQLGKPVEISTDVDDGFEIRWIWGDEHEFEQDDFWLCDTHTFERGLFWRTYACFSGRTPSSSASSPT